MLIIIIQLLIRLLLMEKESKLVFFLKKMGKESHQISQRQKTVDKLGGKLDRIVHASHHISNDHEDSTHVLKRISFKNHHHLYRSLQSNAQIAQSQRTHIQQQPKFITAKSIKRYQLQSLDSQHQAALNKDKSNDVSRCAVIEQERNQKIVKIQNSELGQITLDRSENINTYLEFKRFLSKMSNQSSKQERTSHNKLQSKPILSKNKKCVFKKRQFTRKEMNQPNTRPYLSQFYQYMDSKKTKMQLEKTLFVESKRQQLTSHIIFREKAKSRLNKQLKTLNNEQIKQIKESNDKQLQDIDKVLKIQLNNHKAPKHQKSHRIKYNPKNTSFFNNQEEGVYEQKIRSYRQLLFTVNLAHKIFDPLIILDPISVKQQKSTVFRPTYYIGNGNNSMLIRSLMRRRIWWDQVKDYKSANFVWTQLKVPNIYSNQKSNAPRIYQRIDQQPLQIQTKEDELISSVRKLKGSEKDQLSVDKLFALQKCNDLIQQRNTATLPQKNPKGLIFRAPFTASSEDKILTDKDLKYYRRLLNSRADLDQFELRLKYFPKDYLLARVQNEKIQMHNHFEFNHSLGNKKALFYHMQLYYKLTCKPLTKAFPMTFHIRQGQSDPQFHHFLQYYQQIAREPKHLKNIWILKPGENSNRGSGITVIKQLKTLRKLLRGRDKHRNGETKTFILQKYIERPLLYKGRKFDIRHYMIISGLHGHTRAYWYSEGYIRTSSYSFNLDDVNDPMIHLTNDAIQKECEDYGYFEEGNKISYNQLQKYFNKELREKGFNFDDIFIKMRELAKDAILATYISLDPNNRLHNFEVFGLDFMIDQDMNVMLIEVNTNPCLQLSSNLLARIIPMMLEQSLRVSLDPIFPPPTHYTNNTKHLAPDCSLQKLQMQLIFDSSRDGQSLTRMYSSNKQQYDKMMRLLQGSEKQVDEVFDNQGVQIEIDNLIA